MKNRDPLERPAPFGGRAMASYRGPHQKPRPMGGDDLLQSFLIIVTVAMIAATIGYLVGLQRRLNPDFSPWQELVTGHGIQDLPAFVHVAYIHNAGYVGALVGLIAAIWRLKRMKGNTEQLVETIA